MLRAITRAEKYKYTAKPNPVVGAIIIKDNEIISEGYHQIYGENHAEVNAIQEAIKHQGKKFEKFFRTSFNLYIRAMQSHSENRLMCRFYC